jgi:phosphoglycerate dehydrogenase-like enzyme
VTVVVLPEHDGLAASVAERVPEAEVVGYAAARAGDERTEAATFCCLPYLGGAERLAVLARLPRLAVLQSLSVGVDDLADAVPPGVTLCGGRGLHHEESTAELAVALVLAALRRLPHFVRQQQAGRWEHERTESLDGKRVLLVGHGAIGRGVADRVRPFGARVTALSRTPRPGVRPLAELGDAARSADVLVACLPLNADTRGLVSARVLAALPDGALVVNVGRGQVVDNDALRAELRTGRLRAALDVTDPEPLPADAPEWALPNVLVTPHVGGDTTAFVERAREFLVDQVGRHARGEPLHNVVERAVS